MNKKSSVQASASGLKPASPKTQANCPQSPVPDAQIDEKAAAFLKKLAGLGGTALGSAALGSAALGSAALGATEESDPGAGPGLSVDPVDPVDPLATVFYEPSSEVVGSAKLAPDVKDLLPKRASLSEWKIWIADINGLADEDKSFFFDLVMEILVEEIRETCSVDFGELITWSFRDDYRQHLRLLRENLAYAKRWVEICKNMGSNPMTGLETSHFHPGVHGELEGLSGDEGDEG